MTNLKMLKEAYLSTLYSLFDCNFRQSYINVVTQHAQTGCELCEPFYDCFGKDRTEPVVSGCLPIFENLCNSSLKRIIKVIRLDMETAKIVLKSSPNLKIIHLVRDPRAILNSRLRIYKFTLKRLESQAKRLCDSMFKNTVLNLQLLREDSDLKGRIGILFYEDLSKDPLLHSERLYRFLNFSFTEKVETWIETNMLGLRLNGNPFAVTNRNSSALSQKWRRMVSFSFANTIDRQCRQLYSLLGFLPVESETHLRNVSKSLIKKNKYLDSFIID